MGDIPRGNIQKVVARLNVVIESDDQGNYRAEIENWTDCAGWSDDPFEAVSSALFYAIHEIHEMVKKSEGGQS